MIQCPDCGSTHFGRHTLFQFETTNEVQTMLAHGSPAKVVQHLIICDGCSRAFESLEQLQEATPVLNVIVLQGSYGKLRQALMYYDFDKTREWDNGVVDYTRDGYLFVAKDHWKQVEQQIPEQFPGYRIQLDYFE